MSEGMEIPFTGDWSALEAMIASVVEAVNRLGETLSASLQRSAAASEAAAAGIAKLHSEVSAAGAAAAQTGQQAASSMQKLMGIVTTAGNVGMAISGVAGGIATLAKVGKLMTGVNLATQFTGWIKSAGGVRAALTGIGSRLGALLRNPTFQKIAIGAGLATVAIGGTVLAIKAIRKGFSVVTSVASGVFNGIVSGARKAAASVKGMFSRLTGIGGGGGGARGLLAPFTALAGVIGAGGLLYTAIGQFKEGMADAANFEQIEVSISQFTGSTAKAKAILADLAAFGAKTPFELPDIASTVKNMMGAGMGEEATKIVKEIGEVSKSGQDLQELGDALAKGFAKGRFQTEELNKFLERGINLKPELEALTGASGVALDKAIEAGLSFNVVRAAIANMSKEGGQYFGMLARQSATFTGRVSNLADAWSELRRSFMQPILDALKPILADATDWLSSMVDRAKQFGQQLRDGILSAFILIKNGQTMEFLSAGVELAFHSAVDILSRGFRGAVAFLATALPPVISAAFAKLSDPSFWEGVKSMFVAAGAALAAEVRSAIYGANDPLVEPLRGKASVNQKIGGDLIGSAGKVNFTDVLAKALHAALEAAKKAARGPESDDLTVARMKYEGLLASVAPQLKSLLEKFEVKAPETTLKPIAGSDSKQPAKIESASIAGALARIGGGGFGILVSQAMVQQQQQTNRHLARIAQNTSRPPGPSAAVFA